MVQSRKDAKSGKKTVDELLGRKIYFDWDELELVSLVLSRLIRIVFVVGNTSNKASLAGLAFDARMGNIRRHMLMR